MIEKNRATMQNQFDQWYQNLHARNGVIGSSHASAYGGGSGGAADTSTIASTQVGGSGRDGTGTGGNSSSSLNQSLGSYSMQTEGAEYHRTAAQSSQRRPSSRGGMEYKPSTDAEAKNYSGSNNSSSGGMSAQEYARRLPPTGSSTVTTNAVADSKEDDVNEDILAFYQAKEEMLKLRNASNPPRDR